MNRIKHLFFCLIKDKRSFRERILFATLIDACFVFSVFVFIPYEMFFTNFEEFKFGLSDFWMPLLVATIIYAVILSVHALLKGVLYDLYTSFVFGGTAACYAQSMFLNGVMKNLNGTGATWDLQQRIVNLIIWTAIVFVPVVLRFIWKKGWKTVMTVGSVAVVVAQGAALASLALTTKIPVNLNRITDKGLYEISGGNNVIIFCLDTFDREYIDEMLEEYPDAFEKMNGFTYYPNAVASYSFTHIAVPYLLTGIPLPEYNPTHKQFIDQMNTSEYFKWLAENTGDFGVYTEEWLFKDKAHLEMLSNIAPIEKYRMNNDRFAKASLRSSLYRVLPFQFKAHWEYTAAHFNDFIFAQDGEIGLHNAASHQMEAAMSDRLKDKGLSINPLYGDSCFRFIHVQGVHPRYNLTDMADYSEEQVPREMCAMGELTLVSEYCASLNELGLFEDATIIVTADHGYTTIRTFADREIEPVLPVFFYKPAGIGIDQAMQTSNAPVTHGDILATVSDAFGWDGSQYGYVIDEIPEDMERIRYFYWPTQDPLITDRESCIHVEFRIDGDARDVNNWVETGKQTYPNGNPNKEKGDR